MSYTFERKVVAIASDHAGFELKRNLVTSMNQKFGNRVDVIDLGCYEKESVDYPDYAQIVCKMILDGEATNGILICGTGVGMCMAANKFPSIRAVVGTDVGVVKLAREHNNANVLCLGARVSPSDFQTKLLIDVFLYTEFSENKRHIRRINKIEKNFNDQCCEQCFDHKSCEDAHDSDIKGFDEKLRDFYREYHDK